jgi:hypothetical protein
MKDLLLVPLRFLRYLLWIVPSEFGYLLIHGRGTSE